MTEIKWLYLPFRELNVIQLYSIMHLRSAVFVLEQNCVYLDPDNKDQQSYHLTAFRNEKAVAYCRIMPPGLSYTEASIGRVATALEERRNGTGRKLMQLAIDHTLNQFENAPIRIGAQLYLQRFYSSLGFINASEEYLEDGIPHIEMLYQNK